MIYVFLAEGFEEVEALCPLDLMRRAGLSVTTVGVGGTRITGTHGITVEADLPDSLYRDPEPELIFLPGGMPGTRNLAASPVVTEAISRAAERHAYLAAICAAPSILGEMGLLRGKEAVCFPGFEGSLIGAIPSERRVVRDGTVITAVGMGAAFDMGIAIVETLCGTEKAKELRHAVLAD